MRIPPTIKSAGGIEYKVVLAPDLGDDFARVDFYNKQILLDMRLDHDFMCLTLCHEIWHTINNEFDHELVEFLGQALYNLLIENNFYG